MVGENFNFGHKQTGNIELLRSQAKATGFTLHPQALIEVDGAVVTSKVLNEGVDVPDANVAVVISGSGSVREHVQRLGRILRQRDGKRALLYELVSAGTTETQTSERRREHEAYR